MIPRTRPTTTLLWAFAIPLLCLPAVGNASGSPSGSFVNFESGQVRPLALSPDGTRLFAVNTPDNRLEIFAVGRGGLSHAGSVPVGMEPVAVAARTDAEVWVVNLLSDSVSIVDVARSPPRVTRTLLTCDEPRDIVFAGPGGDRAFVTTARRGQNCPLDSELTTAGSPRAIVQVFDATALDPDTRSPARRSPTSSSSATRRARSRAAPTATRSTRPSSSPATRPRRSARARSATAARPRRPAARCSSSPAACRRRT